MLFALLMLSGTACSSEIAEDLLDTVIEEMEAGQTTTVPEDAQPSDAVAEDPQPSDSVAENPQPSDAVAEDPQPSDSVAENPQNSDAVTDLEALHDPSIFTRTALEHIFVGSVNSRGAASGYHSEAYPEALGEVIGGTRSKPDADGVYEAKVRVDGIDKAGNRGYSTFFPEDMTVEQVVQAIREAYKTRNPVTGNTWRGEGGNLSILMYLDDNDRIISAFPEYGG